MMKKLLPVMFLLAVLAAGCTKQCQCIKYDGTVVNYTEEQVYAQGKSCSDMVFFSTLSAPLYSKCEWKY